MWLFTTQRAYLLKCIPLKTRIRHRPYNQYLQEGRFFSQKHNVPHPRRPFLESSQPGQLSHRCSRFGANTKFILPSVHNFGQAQATHSHTHTKRNGWGPSHTTHTLVQFPCETFSRIINTHTLGLSLNPIIMTILVHRQPRMDALT